MTDLRARACRFEDAAALADLINTLAEAAGGRSGYVAAELEDVLREEVADLWTDTLAVTDAEDRLVAAALVPLPPPGGRRVELIGGVHPGKRLLGIGRRLLSWQLARAAALRAQAGVEGPWQAQVAAPAADAGAARLYARLGFTVARHFLEMTAPAARLPCSAPQGVRLVPYTPDQEPSVHAAHNAAFRDLWGFQERTLDGWAALTVRSDAFRAGLSRLAVADDGLAGYVLTYHSDLPGHVYIGQLGTAPAWRRRGIASALLAAALTAAADAGHSHATLDTDAENPTGAPAVYARAGFTVTQHVTAYHQPV